MPYVFRNLQKYEIRCRFSKIVSLKGHTISGISSSVKRIS